MMGRAREFLKDAASFATLGAGAWFVIVWLTGGLKPGTQIQMEELTAQVERLQKTAEQLANRLDSLPRPADYTSLGAHLERTDAQVAIVVDRLTHDEIEAAKSAQQVQQLIAGTGVPVRQPR
jgi:multidrug efflux pump subunit AcrB